jgi:hypothetical protein
VVKSGGRRVRERKEKRELKNKAGGWLRIKVKKKKTRKGLWRGLGKTTGRMDRGKERQDLEGSVGG